MSDEQFPSCAYDVCAEFDCEETMALALIATRNELERTRKALETLQEFIMKLYLNGDITDERLKRHKKMLITALEQKDVK